MRYACHTFGARGARRGPHYRRPKVDIQLSTNQRIQPNTVVARMQPQNTVCAAARMHNRLYAPTDCTGACKIYTARGSSPLSDRSFTRIVTKKKDHPRRATSLPFPRLATSLPFPRRAPRFPSPLHQFRSVDPTPPIPLRGSRSAVTRSNPQMPCRDRYIHTRIGQEFTLWRKLALDTRPRYVYSSY